MLLKNYSIAIFLALVLFITLPVSAANFNPETTITVYVHGYSGDGWLETGTFGDDHWDSALDNFLDYLDLPTMMEDPFAPNQIAATTYYGDAPPDYYTPEDIAEIDSVTAIYGGGVPRYALIVAKYIRHVMERSGAESVNVLGASFGALVSRYMLEKDLEHLTGDGLVDRWLIYVGSLAGNFAASNRWLVDYYEEIVGDMGPDVDHLNYEWVADNIWPDPWSDGNPLLGGIIKHEFMGTNDAGTYFSLTLLSGGLGNDSVTLIRDAQFRDLDPAARFAGIYMPTTSYFNAIHDEISEHPGTAASTAWAVTSPRRVKITVEDVTIPHIDERKGFYPGEVVFQAKVYSPYARENWGVDRAINTITIDDNNVEIFDWLSGETKTVNEIMFYGPVSPEETFLEVDLSAVEVDWWPLKDIIEDPMQRDDILMERLERLPVEDGKWTLRNDNIELTVDVVVEDLY